MKYYAFVVDKNDDMCCHVFNSCNETTEWLERSALYGEASKWLDSVIEEKREQGLSPVRGAVLDEWLALSRTRFK